MINQFFYFPGPNLKTSLKGHEMVNSNGNLVVIGGRSGSKYQSSLHVLSCYNGYCQWQELQQKLQTARMNFVAMTVPDDFVDCCDLSLDPSCVCKTTNSWECPNSSKCIQEDQKCDGLVNCHDQSDEMNCLKCQDEAWKCLNSSQCIHESLLCDGHEDCEEHSATQSGFSDRAARPIYNEGEGLALS